jgi:predicted exporter
MTRTRALVGVLGLVLVAVLTVVWVLPTAYGPSLECRDIDAEACDRVWRAAAAEADGVQVILHVPVTKALVIGPEECPQVLLDWVVGGVINTCN